MDWLGKTRAWHARRWHGMDWLGKTRVWHARRMLRTWKWQREHRGQGIAVAALMGTTECFSHSQSYRAPTHEGCACFNGSETEGSNSGLGVFTKGNPMRSNVSAS
eukprot:365960-Chlamydomonas_euryale.AAC.8